MARPSNTEARRAQIVEGFLKVVAERGYDGASIPSIAKAADLTPGLIHYHFKTKEQVLEAAVHTLAARHQTRLAARLDELDDPLEQLAAFFDLHVGLGAEADPVALAAWVVMGAESTRRPAIQEAYRAAVTRWIRTLEDVVVQAQARQCVKVEDPRAAATALVAAIQGYFELAAAVPGEIPRGSAAPSLCAMANGLLRPARPFQHIGGER